MSQGFVLWFTGLSGSGKSTVSEAVVPQLRERGVRIEVLDGDVVRTNLSKGLGFSKEDRDTNILRVGFVANLLARNGLAACCACISPYREIRDTVRGWVEGDGGQFVEIFMDTPLDTCIDRDPKGLYKKALAGEIKQFTGIDDPYEAPENPEIRLRTTETTPEECARQILRWKGPSMGWEAWFTVALIVFLVAVLTLTRISPDVVLLGGVTLLLAVGILEPFEALAGLAQEGMVTVGVLYVVVAGVQNTGGLAWIVQHLLRRPTSLRGALARVTAPVAGMSAFLNNTPVVAMMIPAVADWAKKIRIPVSKLMIPLSYGAILGGICTLIGTSTNLVVNGLVLSETDLPGLGMFTITWVGLPCALAGGAYLLLIGHRFLPDRQPAISTEDDPRRYTVEMTVDPDGPLVGRTIEQAGLRHLPKLYLMEIERDGEVRPAVGPEEVLQGGDRLVFVGIVDSVVELQKMRGLGCAAWSRPPTRSSNWPAAGPGGA